MQEVTERPSKTRPAIPCLFQVATLAGDHGTLGCTLFANQMAQQNVKKSGAIHRVYTSKNKKRLGAGVWSKDRAAPSIRLKLAVFCSYSRNGAIY